MNKLLQLIIILISVPSFAQVDLDIINKKLDYFIKKENTLGSEQQPVNGHHLSLSSKKLAQPIKFLRNEEHIPDLIVEYHFYEQDSVVSYILYEWDVYNFDNSDNNVQTPELQEAMITKYNELENIVSTVYGTGVAQGSLEDLSLVDSDKGLKKTTTWKTETTEIEMYTTLSNYFRQSGIITINPTHRIRLYVRNITEN